MYIKVESVGEASHTHPIACDVESGDSPLSEETSAMESERLKSVVVVQERTDREMEVDKSMKMETGRYGGGCGNSGEP